MVVERWPARLGRTSIKSRSRWKLDYSSFLNGPTSLSYLAVIC